MGQWRGKRDTRVATNTVRFAVEPGVFKRQSKRAGRRGSFCSFYWSFFDDVPIRELFGMAGRLAAHTNMLPHSSRKTSGSWVSRGPWVFGRAFGTLPASRPSRNGWAPPSLGPSPPQKPRKSATARPPPPPPDPPCWGAASHLAPPKKSTVTTPSLSQYF